MQGNVTTHWSASALRQCHVNNSMCKRADQTLDKTSWLNSQEVEINFSIYLNESNSYMESTL